MKKIITTALVLSGMVAYAQTGNVGINENTPTATLHLKVAEVNLTTGTNAEKTSNQGIIIPQMTKQRIADIAEANLIDGTMVYATTFNKDVNTFPAITQTDDATKTRVSQITTKDFYKYNAERGLWERMSTKRLVKPITANYTLTEADYHYYLYVNSTSDVTITVPTDLKNGFTCIVVQEGTGKAIISGTTVQGANGTKTKAQHSAIGIIVRNTKDTNTNTTVNTATVTGDTTN